MMEAERESNLIKLPDSSQYVLKSTGEVITQEDIRKAEEEHLVRQFGTFNDDLRENGIKSDLKLVRCRDGGKRPTVTIKEKHEYGKVFRVDVREVMKNGQLSINARAFLATVEPFISFPQNTIIVDSKNPTYADLGELMGVSEKTIYRSVKELEEKDILKRKKVHGQYIIYMNPFLYSCGAYVLMDTYELFKYSVYNPDKNNN